MLLSAGADGADFVFSVADLFETILDCLIHGIDPDGRILLHMPIRQAGDQFVVLLRGRQYSTGLKIDDDGFSALRAAINTDVEHTDYETATDQGRLTNPNIQRVANIITS